MLLISRLLKLKIDTLKTHFDIFASRYYDYYIKKIRFAFLKTSFFTKHVLKIRFKFLR